MSFSDNLAVNLTMTGWAAGSLCSAYKGYSLFSSASVQNKVKAVAFILAACPILTGIGELLKTHYQVKPIPTAEEPATPEAAGEPEAAEKLEKSASVYKLKECYEIAGNPAVKIFKTSCCILSIAYNHVLKIATHDTTAKALEKSSEVCDEVREKAGRIQFSAIKLTVSAWTLGAVYGVYKGYELTSSATTRQHKLKAVALILGSVNVLANFLYIAKPNADPRKVSHLNHWCEATYDSKVVVKICKATVGILVVGVTDLCKHATREAE